MKRCLRCEASFTGQAWTCPVCQFQPPVEEGIPLFAPEAMRGSGGYDPNRYETISRFQQEHFWFKARNELIAAQLEQHFPRARSLLEIGCGTGQVLRFLRSRIPQGYFCGTEIHVQGLAYARDSMPDTELLQIDARAIPFQGEFDVVCAFDVIEHIDDDRAVLKQLYEACALGGGLLLTVPQHQWLWSYKDEIAHHKRRYDRRDLVEKIETAGFDIAMVSSFVSLLTPLMLMSRLNQKGAKGFDPDREFAISPQLNRVLLGVSRLENRLIKFGARFPIGGSLLVVAKKR